MAADEVERWVHASWGVLCPGCLQGDFICSGRLGNKGQGGTAPSLSSKPTFKHKPTTCCLAGTSALPSPHSTRLRAELWQSAAERRGTAARRAAAMQDLPLTSRGRLPHTSGSETSSSGGGGGGARSRSSMELIRVTPRASGAACSGASMLVGGGASSRASGGAARASPGGGAAASPSGSGGSGVGAAGLLPAAGARSGVAAAPAPTPAAAAAKAAKGGTAGSLASSTTPAAAAPASKKTSALPPPTQPRPRFL